MTTTDERGSAILSYIEQSVIYEFLKLGKNSTDNDTLIQTISGEICNPYKIIPYTFYPDVDALDEIADDGSVFYEAFLKRKLAPLIPQMMKLDWNTMLSDVVTIETENVDETESHDAFSMSENAPISALETINTPNTKFQDNTDDTHNLSRSRVNPYYAFEALKTNRDFVNILARIDLVLQSIFLEYNTIY